MKNNLWRLACIASLGMMLHAQATVAQSFPDKPVRFIVGYSPGGLPDTVARIVAQKLGERWKQQVVVENKPGANNQLAAVLVRSMGESIALCEAAGLDRATVVEALVTTATRVCGLKKEKLLKRDWSTDFALSLMLKDIDLVLSTAAQLNVAMPQLATAREIYRQAEARGAGDMDFAAVIET